MAAATISSSVASGRPMAMFSRTVARLTQVSCKTMPQLPRRLARVRPRTSWPSTVTLPESTS